MIKKNSLRKRILIVMAAATVMMSLPINTLAATTSAEPTKVENAETNINTFSNDFNGMGGAFISDNDYIDTSDFTKEIKNKSIKPYATQWYNLPGTTYRYEQLDPFYCVPATMQTIIRYNTGKTPPSQATIAKDMGFKSGVGVDFLKVPDYLNGKQSKATYSIHKKTSNSQSGMCARIEADITDYVVPTSIRIEVSNSSDWFYTTAGHAIVSNSIMSDYSKVQLVDPGVGHSWYQKNTSDLYKVFTHLAW